jgi:hypothetical protein
VTLFDLKTVEFEATTKKDAKNRKAGNLKDIAAALSLDVANENKERLLEFDRNSQKRTKVIDDEFDYFNIGQQNWITDDQRAEVKAKASLLHEKKFVTKTLFHLDLDAGGIVETVKPEIEDFQKEMEHLSEQSAFKSDYEFVDFKQIMDKEIEMHPYYVQKADERKTQAKPISKNLQSIYNLKASDPIRRMKMQDSALMSVHDEGFCLSMQQPHASHTIHGIKLHEGRKWFTPFRGRLWIHSSAKPPRQEEIQEAQQFFKLYNQIPPKYPKKYPLSSLLGCVELIDCLPQEEYRKQFPNGYCNDEFVLLLDNPILLKSPLPASGQLKIYKLADKQHQAALSQLKL